MRFWSILTAFFALQAPEAVTQHFRDADKIRTTFPALLGGLHNAQELLKYDLPVSPLLKAIAERHAKPPF